MLSSIFLFKAFVFGVTIAAAVGPIALIIINVTLKRGVRSGILGAFGASVADCTCGLIAFTLYGVISRMIHQYHDTMQICAGIMLFALGLYLVWAACKEGQARDAKAGLNVIVRNPFSSVYLLTMASPMTIPAFIAFIGHVSGTISMLDSVLGSVLILIGSMLVQVPIVLCANSIKPLLLRGNTMKYINILCGVAIMIYSIYAVVSLIH